MYWAPLLIYYPIMCCVGHVLGTTPDILPNHALCRAPLPVYYPIFHTKQLSNTKKMAQLHHPYNGSNHRANSSTSAMLPPSYPNPKEKDVPEVIYMAVWACTWVVDAIGQVVHPAVERWCLPVARYAGRVGGVVAAILVKAV